MYDKRNRATQGYEDLGKAIVLQAVQDYKSLAMCDSVHMRVTRRGALKKFFFSDWCYSLCGIEPGVWVDFIKKEDAKKRTSRF